jgi:hypothetical protein
MNVFKRIEVIDSIEIVVKDKYGNIKSKHTLHNSIWDKILVKLGLRHHSMTNDGFAQNAAWILSDIDVDHSTYANCNWVAIGTNDNGGGTAEGPTNYKLNTLQSILAAVGTRVTTGGITNNTAQLVVTFSQANDAGLTGTDAIVEVGVFWDDTPDDHTMLLRQVYTPADSCNWDQQDTMTVTVKIQVKQGA